MKYIKKGVVSVIIGLYIYLYVKYYIRVFLSNFTSDERIWGNDLQWPKARII